MSVYFEKDRNWWTYEFQINRKRYRKRGFKLKKDAQAAKAEAKKKARQPPPQIAESIAMDFLELVNRRLDYIQAWRAKKYYDDWIYMAKRWVAAWPNKSVEDITPTMVERYLIDLRNKVSAYSANKELRALRSLFNFGIKPPNRWFAHNPTDGMGFFPVEKKPRYVPPMEDVIKVILAANEEQQEYLWTIALTMGRMGEINKLKWQDVDFSNSVVTLYSRKTKGGNLLPRKIPMCSRQKVLLKRKYDKNQTPTPWVFHHTYFSRKIGEWVTGPYNDRKRMMTTLCKKVGVKYFRFHPLRHFGASMLERDGVSIKTIQEILGHSNRQTTEIYLHSIEGSDQAALERYGKSFDGLENGGVFRKPPINKKGLSAASDKPLYLLARPAGFEPATP